MQQQYEDQNNQTKEQKTIYKVKLAQSLILRPGQNIIIFPTIFDNQPLLGYCCQIYINQINNVSIPFDFTNNTDNFPAIYKGCIDQVTFLPNGEGEIDFNNNIKFSGYFKDGFANGKCKINNDNNTYEYSWGWKHGPFEIQIENYKVKGDYKNNQLHGTVTYFNEDGSITKPQEYYYNNVQIDYPPEQYKLQTTRYIFNHKEFSISNFLYLGINDHNWLNQIVVDYYLELIQDYFRVMNPDKTIILINSITCQDIFSSYITDLNVQIQEPQNIKDQIVQNKYNRIILVLNVDRSHFVTLVFQNNTLYLLNSLNYLDEQILEKVIQLFYPLERQINRKVLTVPQQQNGYDCSLYSIFYVLMQYFNIDTPVDQIDYSIVTPQKTSYLRYHLRNILQNDYSHLIPIYN